MKSLLKIGCIAGLWIIGYTSTPVHAQNNGNTVIVKNEFIKIVANNQTDALGRFAVETTKGNPQNPNDDDQSLIFGRPLPWTSYTTIQIDDKTYIFGGPSKLTEKRSRSVPEYGQFIEQKVIDDEIFTTFQFDKIRVTQTLTMIRNPSTKVRDTALIRYEALNQDSKPHKIAMRIMLDTKLGSNDGAPFRIGNSAVQSESKFDGTSLQDYWQTFDNLASPNVIAQGTINLPEAGVVAPNRMILANWGTLVDNPWEFTYQPGRSFIREGETENDTALAMYWDPISVAPLEARTIQTMYGLGGVTLSPGDLSLGLSMPSEIYYGSTKEHLIMAYIYNSGGFDSKDTTVTFSLPPEAQVVKGSKEVKIGYLYTGETMQIPLTIKLNKSPIGIHKITVDVHSATLDSNRISQSIEILSPPRLKTEFVIPAQKSLRQDRFFDAILRITNDSPLTLQNISAELQTNPNLRIPNFETTVKQIHRIRPQETKEVNWKLKHITEIPVTMNFTTIISSPLTITQKDNHAIKTYFPPLNFTLSASKTQLKEGDYFYILISMPENAGFEDENLILHYDNSELRFIRQTPELWVTKTTPFFHVQNQGNKVYLSHLSHPGISPARRICRIHFHASQAPTKPVILEYGNQKVELKLNE